MSQQVKRTHEPSGTEKTTIKHSRTEEEHEEERSGDSFVEEDFPSSQHPSSPSAKLMETKIKDVYTSDTVVSPETLRNTLEDWNSPVIIIIAKHATDQFLGSLDSITSSNIYKAPTVQNSSQTLLKVPISTTEQDVEPNDVVFEENTNLSPDFDFSQAETCKKEYLETRKALNDIRKDFTEEDLIKNVNNESDLSYMREIRSLFTKFVNYGSKTLKMVEEVSKGHTDYLCSMETNIRPNKLDKDFVKGHLDKLKENNKTINIAMFNQTLLDCRSQIHKVNVKLMFDKEKQLMAKAWRTVLISEKRNNSRIIYNERSQQYHTHKENTHTATDPHIPDMRHSDSRIQK